MAFERLIRFINDHGETCYGDVPRGVDSVDDTGRGIEGDGRVEASNSDDFGNGKVLTVDAHTSISFPVYQTKETGV